jgi:acyl-CoA ligase (AMP-forming) (exosortase A-associated)
VQLETFLEQSAARQPGKTALVCGRERYTYAEIETDSNRLAHGLIAAGLERGDRVAICLENSAECVVSIFAALKAGGVFMPINPTTKADKLAYMLADSRATTLVVSERKLRTIESAWNETPHLKNVVVVEAGRAPTTVEQAASLPADAGSVGHEAAGKRFIGFRDLLHQHADCAAPPAKRCIDIDLAALIYTSGSTGQPKGVMLTHLNMVKAATSITTYLENREDDIILNVLPLSFDYGLYQVLMAFKFGGTVVLEKSFTYPHAVLETLVRERVTGLPLVPTVSAILLQMDLSKYDFRYLRYVTNTGAALPTEHITRIRQLLPHVAVYSMYGLTECKRVAYLPPSQVDLRPGSVGKAMPNSEVYIVDETGRRLPPGEVGELVVRGANVMKGYWEDPVRTAERLKPGPLPNEMVLYTGDLFRMDDEGYLYFVGRRDDIIKSRGEKVSPKEVENVLFCHPEIAEAAVVGVPDAVLGQAIRAVVTLKPGATLTERDVQVFCRQYLEDFMVPQLVEFRDALPKTSNGKIDKKQLCGATA